MCCLQIIRLLKEIQFPCATQVCLFFSQIKEGGNYIKFYACFSCIIPYYYPEVFWYLRLLDFALKTDRLPLLNISPGD